MLVEIKIKNFTSFAEEQIFSMIPNKTIKNHKEILLCNNKNKPILLPTAIILGANASGKSNLLKSFEFLNKCLTTGLIAKSGTLVDDFWDNGLGAPYFMYNSKYKDIPTEITISYYRNGFVYEYALHTKGTIIQKESLIANEDKNKNVKNIVIFNRELKKDSIDEYEYIFINTLEENSLYRESLIKQTPHYKTMFSTIIANSNNKDLLYFEDIKQYYKSLVTIYTIYNFDALLHKFETDELFATKVNRLINAIDVNISSVQIERPIPAIKVIKYINQENKLDESRVSDGTKKSFRVFLTIIQALEDGDFCIVDEYLEHELHPHIMEFIVKLFHDKEINKNNAQLIFASHVASLLNQNLFRLDQIYFVEKDEEQKSNVFSIDGLKTLKGDDISQKYLSGRYGAIPNLKDIRDIL